MVPSGRKSLASGGLAGLAAEALRFHAAADSPNTRRAYAIAWRDFEKWCRSHRVEPLPASPATVAAFLTDCARRMKVSSIELRRAAIARAHRDAKLLSPTENPEIRRLLRGIRREKRVAPSRARPLMTRDVRSIVAKLPGSLIGLRDRALCLLGFAGALRRSELVALDVSDLEFQRDGIIVTLRRSKTDQEGAGMTRGVPFGGNPETCPVRAVRDWLDHSASTSGPVFRAISKGGRLGPTRLSDRAVSLILKRRAAAAGLDADRISGHSLRAGFATQAAENEVPEAEIQRQTGHRSIAVLRSYVRHGTIFTRNAAARLGL